jgi:hypothetical protein
MLKDSEMTQTAQKTGEPPSPIVDASARAKSPLPETVDPSPETLFTGESWWRDHFEWLKESGYLLRPRYDPAWVPSWVGTKKDWYKCEDGMVAWVRCRFLYEFLLVYGGAVFQPP